MELFSLLAKLLLDKKEFDKALSEARSAGSDLEITSPTLNLEDATFYASLDEANSATLSDKNATLGLDDTPFDAEVAEANETVVDGPADPDLGLDDTSFLATAAADDATTVTGPADPDLGLEDSAFQAGVAAADATTVTGPSDPDLGLDDSSFQAGVAAVDATTVTGPSDPDLDLDHDAFDSGLSTVESGAESFGTSVKGIFDGIKKALEVAGITAVLTKIGNILKQTVNLAAQTGDAIDKGSIALGLTRQAYQQWDHAMQQSGGSVQDLSRGLMQFRQILGDASNVTNEEQVALSELGITLTDEIDGHKKTRKELAEEVKARLGTEDAIEGHEEALEALNGLMGDNISLNDDQAAAFRSLGISVKNSDDSLKTAQQLMEESLYALAQYEGGDRDTIIDTLFGKNAGAIKALVDGGLEPMVALLQEADDLGLVMSDEEIDNAVAYGDALANLQAELEAIQTAFVQDLMPILTDAITNLTKVLAFFNPRLRENSLADMFSETDKELASDLANIEGTSAAASDMIDKLFSMGDATKLTAKEQNEWKSTAEWLIQNIPGLSEVIDTDTLSLKGNKEEIKKIIENWRLLSKERAISEAKQKKYQALLEKEGEAIDAQAQAYAKKIEAQQAREAQVAAINDAIKNNSAFAAAMKQNFGIDTLTSDADNLQQILAWAESQQAFGLQGFGIEEAREFAKTYSPLLQELGKNTRTAEAESEKLAEKAAAYNTEIEEAQKEFEAWSNAVDTLYGSADTAEEQVKAVSEALDAIPDEKTVTVHVDTDEAHPHAIGARYIPYDNYPAILHRGEEVLTATQARRRDGSEVNLDALGGIVEQAIRAGMESANVNTYVTDREVSKGANRWNGQRLDAGRYSSW